MVRAHGLLQLSSIKKCCLLVYWFIVSWLNSLESWEVRHCDIHQPSNWVGGNGARFWRLPEKNAGGKICLRAEGRPEQSEGVKVRLCPVIHHKGGGGIKANLERLSLSKLLFLHLKNLFGINLKAVFLLMPLVRRPTVSPHELWLTFLLLQISWARQHHGHSPHSGAVIIYIFFTGPDSESPLPPLSLKKLKFNWQPKKHENFQTFTMDEVCEPVTLSQDMCYSKYMCWLFFLRDRDKGVL